MYSSSFDENKKDNKYIDTNVDIALKDFLRIVFSMLNFHMYVNIAKKYFQKNYP